MQPSCTCSYGVGYVDVQCMSAKLAFSLSSALTVASISSGVDMPVDSFNALLKRTACVVGNSSAGIKECSFLGTPVVDIGGRQQGRLSAENVAHAGYNVEDVRAAVKTQLAHGRYAPSHIYFRPDTSQAMVDVLTSVDLYTQKRFHEGS